MARSKLVNGWRSGEYDEFVSGPKSGTFKTCRFCGGLHEVSAWPDNHREPEYDLRSDLGSPFVISDSLENFGLDGIQSQADGRHYTSKSRLRADYRARGMIEIGNDPARLRQRPKPKPDRQKIKEAVHRAWNAVHSEGATAHNYRTRSKDKNHRVFGSMAPIK